MNISAIKDVHITCVDIDAQLVKSGKVGNGIRKTAKLNSEALSGGVVWAYVPEHEPPTIVIRQAHIYRAHFIICYALGLEPGQARVEALREILVRTERENTVGIP